VAAPTAHRDGSFELLIHPVPNAFAEDVCPLWAECFRVLRPGGVLLADFMNPLYFLFNHEAPGAGAPLFVKYPLPYSDPANPDPAIRVCWRQSGLAAEFSHSPEAQIGRQLAAGFVLTALYEDGGSDDITPLNRYTPRYVAVSAMKRA